jgi:hypothetical protein
MRLNKRVAGALKGILLCFVFMGLALLGSVHSTELPPVQAWANMFESEGSTATWQPAVVLPVFFGLMGALGSDWRGHDMLIVDIDSITVVDKRWVRPRDQSFSILWNRIQCIRVFSEPMGTHAIVVKFVDEIENEKVGDQIQTLVGQHNVTEQYDGHVIARIPRVLDNAESDVMLSQLRAALASFGRGTYQ